MACGPPSRQNITASNTVTAALPIHGLDSDKRLATHNLRKTATDLIC